MWFLSKVRSCVPLGVDIVFRNSSNVEPVSEFVDILSIFTLDVVDGRLVFIGSILVVYDVLILQLRIIH